MLSIGSRLSGDQSITLTLKRSFLPLFRRGPGRREVLEVLTEYFLLCHNQKLSETLMQNLAFGKSFERIPSISREFHFSIFSHGVISSFLINKTETS
jgi:hypothetical protein